MSMMAGAKRSVLVDQNNCEGLYRRVLGFDKFSTGRFKLNNIYLCRTNKPEKKLTALQRIQQKVLRKYWIY